MSSPRIPYCTAPWMEMHLSHDGTVHPCCHNHGSLGTWKEGALESTWRDEPYRDFRRAIAEGRYPSEQCRSCVLNQTTSNLYNSVVLALSIFGGHLRSQYGREPAELGELTAALCEPQPQLPLLERRFGALRAWFEAETPVQESWQVSAFTEHLRQLERMTRDFLLGDPNPEYIGPIRQARFLNKCNARCVMCAGKFNGDIVSGPAMADDDVPHVLEAADHLISLASEASEFLLFPRWREIVSRISEKGLPKLRLMTNGALLTPENSRFLVEKRAVETLLISMNAAEKGTLESIQVNMRFERVLANVRSLVEAARAARFDFQLSFSFIVMRRNFREIPAFVRLVQELTAGDWRPRTTVFFPFLESNNDMDGYREFLFSEHHARIDPAALLGAFREANELARRYGLWATLKEGPLDELLRAGWAPEKLPYKERDVPLLSRILRDEGDLRSRLVPASPGAAAAFGAAGL